MTEDIEKRPLCNTILCGPSLSTMIHEKGSKGYWFLVNKKDIIRVFPGS